GYRSANTISSSGASASSSGSLTNRQDTGAARNATRSGGGEDLDADEEDVVEPLERRGGVHLRRSDRFAEHGVDHDDRRHGHGAHAREREQGRRFHLDDTDPTLAERRDLLGRLPVGGVGRPG